MLVHIGFIPISPVGGSKENGWAGERWPTCIRDTKYEAARGWFDRQRWNPKQASEFFSLYTQDAAVKWLEDLGLELRAVHMGELPNAHQS